MEKRGIQMAITTVIMIILSIAILTILIVFFNSQTGFLSKWFKTQQTQSNVDAVISACDGLVISGSVYAYCCEKKEVVFGTNEKEKVDKPNRDLNCSAISKEPWAAGRVGSMDCPVNICA